MPARPPVLPHASPRRLRRRRWPTGASATAVYAHDTSLTYADLAVLVAEAGAALGTGRRLVLIAAENSLDALVTYLGALHAGHVPLLAPGDRLHHLDGLIDAYDPDVVAGRGTPGGRSTERRPRPGHDLHAELALLLTTSGSTGSPKLVRLSHDNLDSNAAAIAESPRRPRHRPRRHQPPAALLLRPVRRAQPPGAGARARAHRPVRRRPLLLDAVRRGGRHDAGRRPPQLRPARPQRLRRAATPRSACITQAGGRLAPTGCSATPRLGRERGWDLFVMYGQTEATARMAVPAPRPARRPRPDASASRARRLVPPRARSASSTAGWASSSTPAPTSCSGYAESPADLALGREVDELRTGDLARLGADGLVEIVGRRSRFAKVVGLRIDLDQVERDLAAAGHEHATASTSATPSASSSRRPAGAEVTQTVTRRHGIPAAAVVSSTGWRPRAWPPASPTTPAWPSSSAPTAHTPPTPPTEPRRSATAADADRAVVALYRSLLSAPQADRDDELRRPRW